MKYFSAYLGSQFCISKNSVFTGSSLFMLLVLLCWNWSLLKKKKRQKYAEIIIVMVIIPRYLLIKISFENASRIPDVKET